MIKLSMSRCSAMTLVHRAAFKRQHLPLRYLHATSVRWVDIQPLKPSSKVEASVLTFKQETDGKKPATVKPPLSKRIVDELKHYYHGFRLLFIDVRISSDLLLRVLRGDQPLSRREKKQLVRTTSDVFRLVPFSVFIIVPFMEFTLPIFLKLFPNMLPSTFQTANEREAKLKTSLKVKLEMAKFLQQTLDEMALKGNGHQSQTAREFAEFFLKIRSSGKQASNEEILRFSKLFEDEITLDSLSRSQLIALCRVLEIAPIGTNSLLRFQLRFRLRSLAADDKVIMKEGLDSLSIAELQAACRARGMRSLGVSEIRLKSQLYQWLGLSLNEKVPPSLLLLSRALYLPDTDSTSEQLVLTIASLPESVAATTRDAISQRRGKTDNETRIQALRLEEAMIREERKDSSGAIPFNKPSVIKDGVVLTPSDVATLENALESIGVRRKKLLIEKEELTELKEEMAEYQEDIEELKDFLESPERKKLVLRESTAARRLFRSVNRMIHKLDGTVNQMEKAANKSLMAEEVVSIEELLTSVRRLQAVEDSAKLQQIVHILVQIDEDRDGAVKVDDVMKVIELLEEYEIHMSPKQMTEVLQVVNKEEILEMEEKAEKSLGQGLENLNAANSEVSNDIQRIGSEAMDTLLSFKTTTKQQRSTIKQQQQEDSELEVIKEEPVRARAGSQSGR